MAYNPNLKKRIQEMQSIFDEINYKLENKNYSPIRKAHLECNDNKVLTEYFEEDENISNEIDGNRKIREDMKIEDLILNDKRDDEIVFLKKRNYNNLKLIEKLKHQMGKINNKKLEITAVKDELILCTENIQTLFNSIKFFSKEFITMKNKLGKYKGEVRDLKEKILYVEKEEKIVREELLNLKGSLRVLLRLKIKNNPQRSPFKILGSKSLLIENKRDKYKFDHIFDSKISQYDVYRELRPMILSVLDGYNICIFAYGQTGSGKTYTMEGEDENIGIIPRAMDNIFLELKKYKEKKITVTQIEIYNDQIRDLIGNKSVDIKYEKEELVLNSEKIEIKSTEELFNLLKETKDKRKIGETKCNLKSSRSHSLFTVKIEIYGEQQIQGTISFIDLAGSERLKESQAEGIRLKETQYINKSLLSLRNVISNIVNNEKYIPFRDSKLTYLLKNYLQNKSRVAMIVNISPDLEDLNETICSLKFGQIARNCIIGPSVQNSEKYI